MSATIFGVIIGIVLLLLLTLIKKDSKYAKSGINLGRVYCPNCNLKQPIIRKPANERQALYGGHTCKKCGTEIDKHGTEVK